MPVSLKGRKVLITRPLRPGKDPLDRKLRKAGAQVVWLPALEVAAPDKLEPLDAALKSLATFDWATFTSQNAVEAVWSRLGKLGLRWGERPRAAAVGRKTAAALLRLGKTDVFVAPDPLASSLASSLAWGMAGKRVLWPKAQVGPLLLADELRKAGAEVTAVAAYQTRPTGADAGPVKKALQQGMIDAVAFASARSIEATLEALGPSAKVWLQRIPKIVIGPVTAEACQDLGLGKPTIAEDATISALVDAVADVLAGSDTQKG